MDQRITPIHYRKLVRVFEKDGWYKVKQRGSHMAFKKEETPGKVVIPRYKVIPVFIIKKNMEIAKMSRERYFELLKEV